MQFREDMKEKCQFQEKDTFISKVFANLDEIVEVNSALQRKFKERQNKNKNLHVDAVSDIFAEEVRKRLPPLLSHHLL